MRNKKLISGILAGIMTVAMSYTAAIAEESDIVYTYTDENGETVNITQTQLDTEHWNKDALGDDLPMIYESFPASVRSDVGEFSDLSVAVRYMKNADTAQLSVTDLRDGSSVMNASLLDGRIYTPALTLGVEYKFTINETIDGENSEYTKYVTATMEDADMPDYVTDHNTESEQVILVGDVADLRASEVEDEDGNIEIIDGAKRFDQVKACDFEDYIADMKSDTIYKIYTKDESENTYLGYMSTYEDEDETIYMPSIAVSDIESGVAPCTLSQTINSRLILASDVINMSQYRDYLFYTKDSSSKTFQAFKFEIPNIVTEGTPTKFDFDINASTAFTLEAWSRPSTGGSLTKLCTKTYSSGSVNATTILGYFSADSLSMGDYLYFVLYFPNATSGKGYISFSETSDTYTDDVSGSAYLAYKNKTGSSCFTPSSTEYQYTLTDYRDIDTFYINYSGTSSKAVRVKVDNASDTDNKKYIEVAGLTPKSSGMESIQIIASDLIEVAAGGSKLYTIYPCYTDQMFILISAQPTTNSDVLFNTLNNSVTAPMPYSFKAHYVS